MRLAITLPAIVLALTGCMAGVTPIDKGAEDALPLDGKADSFRSPTEHGQLRFASASHAEISEEALFHAWTFELSGHADVALEVSSYDQNLDTVMYLYHRDSAEDSWGSYIEKNDDFGDSLQSRIDRAAHAGQLRVIVKGFKEHHRGTFSIEGTCRGRGCDVPDPGDVVVVPPETGFTRRCVNALWESIGSPMVSGDSFGISPNATTGFDRAVLVATAHYADLSDFDEYIDEEEAAEFTFGVEYWQLENGAVVELADGGDESTTDYAFDAAGNLLAYYVHNQSPWTGFYCGYASDEAADEPTEDCVSAWMNLGPRAAGSVHAITETWEPGAPNDEIDTLMAVAVARYQAEVLEDDDSIAIGIEATEWEGPDGGLGADLLLSADGAELVSYTVVFSEWGDPWLVFESSENDDEGPHMTCER